MPLQRVLVDFGSDHAFGQVPAKLQEHYGIDMAVSTIRHITEQHAGSIHIFQQKQRYELDDYPKHSGVDTLIVETDGSMIPIVKIDDTADDKRKAKKIGWKEARLSLAHQLGKVTPRFGVDVSQDVDVTGNMLFDAACKAGLGNKTYVHAVGDGAPWIVNQVKRCFGAQGHYLVDFYHVCSYLAATASHCSPPEQQDKWLKQQKSRLKTGKSQLLIDELNKHLEPKHLDNSQAPIRACLRYLNNRLQQLNYNYAAQHKLPIGSGEIESAHRYVIQQRLKLTGAWWTLNHASDMLALRALRANQEWGQYWKNLTEMPHF